MKRFLVTGGAGFIGSHLVESLLVDGHEVVVFDNFTSGSHQNVERATSAAALRSGSGSIEERVTVCEGDIRDAELLVRCAKECEGIVHLAAMVSVQESVRRPRECFEMNATGTLNALEAARQAAVPRFVFASSAAVYGDEAPVPVSESSLMRPLTPYGATKGDGELHCATYAAAYGVTTVPLRFFNVFGEYQDPTGPYAAVISKFADCFEAGAKPRIFGDGQQTRDFVYVRDVVRAICLALEVPHKSAGLPINIGTGHTTSLLELVDAFAAAWDIELTPDFKPERSGDIRHSCSVTERASRLLGFTATTSVVDGLRAIRRSIGEENE